MERQPSKFDVLNYYSQEHVLDAIINSAKDREAVGVFSDGSYDKRPNIIQYKPDILNMIKNGVTSVHLSAEHWTYPMQLVAENYEQLRKGFDIIIDIDSKLTLDESKTAAIFVCDFLKRYGVKNYGLKFSGRRGFHICIPWKMLPKEVDFKPMKTEYPRIPRIVSDFIRNGIREKLLEELMRNRKPGEIVFEGEVDPFQIVEIEKDWGNRHLFRAPFSVNEKTWLVSKPIDYNDLRDFEPSHARMDAVKKPKDFFKECEEGEAEYLVSDALDWHSINTKHTAPRREARKQVITKKIGEEHFPPCIKLIIGGLKDGKKRSLFTIINFLRAMNWSWEEVEEKLNEINSRNSPKLPRQAMLSQINWARQQNRTLNPANCSADMFYKGIGICRPDERCKQIKNPISYPFISFSKPKKMEERKLKCYKCNKEFDEMSKLMGHKKRHR